MPSPMMSGNTQSSPSLPNNDSRTSLIRSEASSKPIGIRLFGSCFRFGSQKSKKSYHQALVLLLTFIAYTAFHMGRRPLSVVKNVLNRNCSAILDHDSNFTRQHLQSGENLIPSISNSSDQVDTSCDWAPFDDDATADQLLALLDSAFLSAYAFTMFGSGIIAERMNLRYLITAGTVISGLGLIAFGLAYPLEIHSMIYMLIVQLISGAAQSTGWPVVVTCVSHWFDPKRLGLIYGLWNSHTNLGNIVGATISGFFVEKDWGLSFIVPGCIMLFVALILFLFLVPHPEDVDLYDSTNCSDKYDTKRADGRNRVSHYEDPQNFNSSANQRPEVARCADKATAISFTKALMIPGVIEYSLCLFFSKLVSYTFLYWLPRFVALSTLNDSEDSAYLSTPFDVGGIFGSIIAGHLSDRYRANGITCTVMLIAAIPSMFVYQHYGPNSSLNNILIQLVLGVLVNGPYCLISTAVSADLGHRVSDGRAMATVSAIIDGMGSIGAVVGPLVAGFASKSGDWTTIFVMLMLSDVIATLCLVRITIAELRDKLGLGGTGPAYGTSSQIL